MMNRIRAFFHRVTDLYVSGFKNLSWGKPLWILIIVKLIIIFAVFRLFFFKPVLSGKTEEQKSEYVGKMLTKDNNQQQ